MSREPRIEPTSAASALQNLRQERYLLLGILALLAPLPLPLNDVLLWPLLGLYLILVAVFLQRSRHGIYSQLPTWVLNVLGLAYLPVLGIDLVFSAFGGQLVQSMVHVCMFTVIVKLFALGKRRDESFTLLPVFFLFLAGVGTSVHPSVVLYLLVFAAIGLILLTRHAQARTLESLDADAPVTLTGPPRLAAALSAWLIVASILSVPLFTLFPRISNPYVGMRTGTGTQIRSTGFSDEVTLNSIGGLRDNPEVVMRLEFDESRPENAEIRFKGGTHDIYHPGQRRWQRAEVRDITLTNYRGQFQLTNDMRLGSVDEGPWVNVWLLPIRSRAVPVPVKATRLELLMPILAQDEGGAIYKWTNYRGPLNYRVWLQDEVNLTAILPKLDDPDESTLDLTGLTPAMADLAAEAMGEGSAAQRAFNLETHLIQNYNYSTDFVGEINDNPIEDFLFTYRTGHCELFASSMVLMLRSEGIPARLVSGFLGAEYNRLTRDYTVRQRNAHAWVEAYLPESGWRQYDPTPPVGRPTGVSQIEQTMLRQITEYLNFHWDRYILTFGLQDQISFLWGLRNWLLDLTARLRGDGDDSGDSLGDQEAAQDPTPVAEGGQALSPWWLVGGFALVTLVILLALWLQRRGVGDATRAFQDLRRLLQRRGLEISDSTAPLELQRRAGEQFPEAHEPAARVIRFYLRESFGGDTLSDEERQATQAALEQTRRALQRPARTGGPDEAGRTRRPAA